MGIVHAEEENIASGIRRCGRGKHRVIPDLRLSIFLSRESKLRVNERSEQTSVRF